MAEYGRFSPPKSWSLNAAEPRRRWGLSSANALAATCLTACDRDASEHTAKDSLWPNGATAGPSYGCWYRRSHGAPAILFAMEQCGGRCAGGRLAAARSRAQQPAAVVLQDHRSRSLQKKCRQEGREPLFGEASSACAALLAAERGVELDERAAQPRAPSHCRNPPHAAGAIKGMRGGS